MLSLANAVMVVNVVKVVTLDARPVRLVKKDQKYWRS
jgi:hypothetical protein